MKYFKQACQWEFTWSIIIGIIITTIWKALFSSFNAWAFSVTLTFTLAILKAVGLGLFLHEEDNN